MVVSSGCADRALSFLEARYCHGILDFFENSAVELLLLIVSLRSYERSGKNCGQLLLGLICGMNPP